MNKKRILITIAALYVVLITLLSIINISVNVEPESIGYLDKVVHFCFYFSMNLLLMAVAMVCYKSRGKWMLLSTVTTIIYSICIEVVQIYVGRDFDLLDILANSLGAFSAMLIVRNSVINNYLRRYLGVS